MSDQNAASGNRAAAGLKHDQFEQEAPAAAAQQAGDEGPLLKLERLLEGLAGASPSDRNAPAIARIGGEATRPADFSRLPPSNETHDNRTETTAVDSEAPLAVDADDVRAHQRSDRSRRWRRKALALTGVIGVIGAAFALKEGVPLRLTGETPFVGGAGTRVGADVERANGATVLHPTARPGPNPLTTMTRDESTLQPPTNGPSIATSPSSAEPSSAGESSAGPAGGTQQAPAQKPSPAKLDSSPSSGVAAIPVATPEQPSRPLPAAAPAKPSLPEIPDGQPSTGVAAIPDAPPEPPSRALPPVAPTKPGLPDNLDSRSSAGVAVIPDAAPEPPIRPLSPEAHAKLNKHGKSSKREKHDKAEKSADPHKTAQAAPTPEAAPTPGAPAAQSGNLLLRAFPLLRAFGNHEAAAPAE